ncbi:lamin tail domain-containing protein [Winogradskyella litorisediminis]|uniref:Lamin tail domain-containing protein n=1 Tax=Winogradskyella litorisediminis TaxID=1156618 RepID=A0ABW3N8T8_9FLAO
MKKLYFLLLTILFSAAGFCQGTETFDNFAETGTSYANGTFEGQDGSTWTYNQSRGDQSITGKSIMLGRNRSPQAEVFSGTISGGIGTLSFNYQRTFSTNVNLNVLVNDVIVGNVTSTDGTVQNSGTITVNQPGNFVLKFISANNSDGQVTIDDITWTNFSTSCGVILGTASYTCNSNNVGDTNDSVIVNIPYTGSDMGITSVTTTSGGTVTGDNPATTADGTISITNLIEGDSWDIVLNGGDCDTFSVSGTVPAAECDPIPNTCFDLSNGMNNFELVVVTPNSQSDEWSLSNGTYSMNGFCGGGCTESIETWMVFGPLDMTGVTDLALSFDATESFGVTDLVFAYTDSYSGCPSTTSWTTAQTITDAGSYDVNLSMATGTNVYIGVQYLDDGADGYSGWNLSNVSLDAFGNCPSLGMVVPSSCAVCDITLGTATYTCDTNNSGANNDQVTVNIPYTGVENTIVNITTSVQAVISGDDPSITADGTITLLGLSEGDAWDITINGGDCDGTTLSGMVPATNCDPQFIVINEILADPDGTTGDANGDGTVSTTEDEFIEIYNTGVDDINLEGYTISDLTQVRHTFPVGATIAAGDYYTIFGGGMVSNRANTNSVASSGSLGLNNGGDTVTITNNSGVIVASVTYGGEAGNNQSIARNPDFTGAFVEHTSIMSNPEAFSPGRSNETALSVNDFNENQFSIFPNPTNTGEITISSINTTAMTVTVYDMLGKKVKNETISNNRLNVSNLKSGIYLLRITQDGATSTKKLVIR